MKINKLKFKDSINSLFLRFSSVGTSFLFSWIIAKSLDTHNAGNVFFIITLLTIAVTISCQGGELALTKIIARIKYAKKQDIIKLFHFSLIRSYKLYFLVVFAFTLFNFIEKQTDDILIIIMYSIIGMSLLYMNLTSYLYQGLGKIALMTLSQRTLFNLMSFSLISIYLLNINEGVIPSEEKIVTILFISAMISLILFLILMYVPPKKCWKTSEEKINFEHYKQQFILSSKFLFKIQVFQLITMYSGQIILNYFSTKSDIAGFVISQRISTIIAFFILASSSIISSKVSLAYERKNLADIHKHAFSSFIFSSSLGIPLSIILILFSNDILSIFGKEYSEFSLVLIILLISQIFNCLTGASDIVLMFIDGEKEHKINIYIGTTIAILTSVVLIPIYGAIGAAISTAISSIIVNILDIISIRIKIGIWLFIPPIRMR
ncbi:hypothetical protein NUITMVP1_30700 [Proteus mirabilis]|uniref:MATE family efflux transporter n=1 Tax=Enterobacterales TaxID=91347 RepID=UPI001F10FEDF|nr:MULTISPECIES: polysaccharide biosynthesis C-terminal domain-containing protein [Enterobacterales]MCH4716282.1 polysaccharide biosynthesis C-terminal domain-containing protein [Escherichia coli]BDR99161.1 hypothetical protein NUITMVP1_30700 [Proteus mirabilis]